MIMRFPTTLAAVVFAAGVAAVPAKADPANTLVIELKSGKVLVALRPDLAPKHVERIKTLARQGFYDNVKFHRVIPGFMAQTGDPTGTGTGGSKLGKLPAEFSKEVFKKGTVGAARTQDPNSADSQFFICFNDSGCKSLTGQYTIWGQVTSGMEAVEKIKAGDGPNGMVSQPDVMQKVYVQTDAKK
jgi:peptidylprolyl isomerase